ncbi:MAG: hypothetical protein AAFS10_25360, partial [Myxococcota bacterium]
VVSDVGDGESFDGSAAETEVGGDAGAEPDTGAADTEGLDVRAPTSAECQLRACPEALDVEPGPPVSFRRDLLPTLQRNCADNPCHGRAAEPFLGPSLPTTPDASEILAHIVGIPSETVPSMLLVEPGAPAESFLIVKVEGCQDALELECTPQPGSTTSSACGGVMPLASRPICDLDRELLRRWVLQGALDN